MRQIVIIISIVFISLIVCGCSKEEVINEFDNTIKMISDNILTKDERLVGDRIFGVDHYIGSYRANYKDFSREEILFGGTTVERKNGGVVHVKLTIKGESGSIKVIARLKGEDIVLGDKNAIYEVDLNVLDGGNFIIVRGDKFSGFLKLEIE